MVLVHHFVLPAPVRMPSDSLFPAKRYYPAGDGIPY